MLKSKKSMQGESKEIKEQRKAIQDVLRSENKEEATTPAKSKEKVGEVKRIEKAKPITTPKPSKKILKKILVIFLIIVLIVIIIIIVFGIGILKYNWQNVLAKNVAKYIPYPVLLVDYKFVKYSDYEEVLLPIKHYIESQLEKKEDVELRKYLEKRNLDRIALNKLLSDNFLIKKSQEFGIVITQAEIDNEFNNIIKQAPGGKRDVEKTLFDFFGWTTDQFKKNVLKPYLYNIKLQDKISQDEKINGEAKKKAKDVLALVKKGEESFENLAEKYSEDLTGSSGGDIGIFGKDEMEKEFEDAAYKLEPNQISDLVRTKYGYHIIKIVEKIKAEDGSVKLHVKHILIKTKNADQWLSEEEAKSKILIILPGYKWEKSCRRILAKDESCDSTANVELPSNINIAE